MRFAGPRPSGLSAERQRRVEKRMSQIRGALVLTTGKYGPGFDCDADAMRRLCDNFNATRDIPGCSVPLILGHDAVHCEQLADVIWVSIPALPANEKIHLAEGSNVLLAGELPPTLQARIRALEKAIAHEVIVMKEIKTILTAPTPENGGAVSGTD